MNVLFVSEYEWFRSVVFDIHIVAEGLSLRGHRVYAIDYEFDGRSGARFGTREVRKASRVYPEAGIHLYRPGYVRLRLRRPSFAGLLPLEYASVALSHYAAMDRIIREKDVDVIVLYSALMNGLPAARLARKHGIPLVFRNIDMLHHLSASRLIRAATGFMERRVYPRADSLLALTPAYAGYLRSLGADESSVRTLPFPIDTGFFRPEADSPDLRRKWGIRGEDCVVAFVGALYRFSALGEFLRRFPVTLRRVPAAKLLIVGDGPLRAELDRIAGELDLGQRVIFTGRRPFSELPGLLSLADVCINAFPTAGPTANLFSAKVLQYMACGRATVSSALPGIMTALPREATGVIYADTVDRMAGEVAELLLSPDTRGRLGAMGIEYVRREHGLPAVASRFEGYLRDAVREKRATAEIAAGPASRGDGGHR